MLQFYHTKLIYKYIRPVVHRSMGCSQKNFKLVWQCHQFLSGFLAKGHLPRVSRQLRLSVMIRVIMKWFQAVHRSPGICLTAEQNPRKPQLGDHLMKGLCNHRLKWGPFPLNEVSRIAQYIRKGEGKDRVGINICRVFVEFMCCFHYFMMLPVNFILSEIEF